jgi:hypothetical protein
LLLLEAYCDGLITLGDDTLDPNWWPRVAAIVDYLLRRDRVKLHELEFAYHLAWLSYADDNEERLTYHRKEAERARSRVMRELRPWRPEAPIRSLVDDMRKRYLERFPAPSSDKGKAAVAKQLQAWKEQRSRHKRFGKR